MMDRRPRDIPEVIAQVVRGETLSEDGAHRLFDEILRGGLGDQVIKDVLVAIQRRSPTVDELVGAARAMRSHLTPLDTGGLAGPVIDTCGTGGAPKTFNVSTIAAIVVAGALPGQIFVAKHGNRSRTGRGSAEILTALGVNVDAPTSVQEACLRACGVCFCFAIHHHPAAKFAGPARRAIGTPTIFNLLGPLTNPAGAGHQLLGVYDEDLAAKVAEALAKLGSVRSLVVHGHGGLDELSTTGPNLVWRIEAGRSIADTLDGSDCGFARPAPDALTVDSLAAATTLASHILMGETTGSVGACRDMVVLSAAAALATALEGLTLPDAATLARESIDSGRARRTLADLAAMSQG